MDELFKENKDKIEAHEKELKENEVRWIGDVKNPLDGRKLWEYNPVIGELLPVEPIRTVALNAHTMQPIYKTKLDTKPNAVYFWCLNEKSAIEKLSKLGYLKSKDVLKK